MTIIEALVQLRDDLMTWTRNNLILKVDKEDGKGLSVNDYTDVDKAKLDSIEEGANKTTVDDTLSNTSTNPVQNKVVSEAIDDLNNLITDGTVPEQIDAALERSVANWAQTDATQPDYIINKPEIQDLSLTNETVAATEGQVLFTTIFTSEDKLQVYYNGVLLNKDIHYAFDNGTITLIDYSAKEGDIFTFSEYNGQGVTTNKENEWQLIDTVTYDVGTSNYTKSDLNLDALLIVCETTAGTSALNGRLQVNGKLMAYFGSYINTSARYTVCRVDLKQLDLQKGVGTDKSGVALQSNISAYETLRSIDAITSIDFGTYATTQLMPAGTKITLYGRMKS